MGIGQSQQQLSYNEQFSSLIDYINIDLDNEYYKLLEIAIESGMTSEEFWNGELVMFAIYCNAYTNRLHKLAFVNGLYFDTSLQTEISNVFLKKGQQPNRYPTSDIFNPKHSGEKVEEIEKAKSSNKLTNKTLYYDNSKAFHIKAILNSQRKEEK